MHASHRPLVVLSLVLTGAFLTTPALAQPRKATYQVESRLAVTVPKDAIRVRIWMPMPQADPASEIQNVVTRLDPAGTATAAATGAASKATAATDAPAGAEGKAAAAPDSAAKAGAGTDSSAAAAAPPGPAIAVNRDSHGNEVGYLEFTRPGAGEIILVQTFDLTREEVLGAIDAEKTRPLNAAEKAEHKVALEASTYIQLTPDIKKLAGEIVGDEKNPARIARKIYDWELANVDYWAKDPERYEPSPMGSAVYCLSTRSGNCADFHSLYIALARSAGIPARMVYGSLLKKQLAGSREDAGTHCWVEIFLPELGWKSVDVSLADLFHGNVEKTPKNEKLLIAASPTGEVGSDEKLVEYYFGNLDERRVVWSRGRDIMLEPAQTGLAVNSLPKAHVEIDGKEHSTWKRMTTFKETAP